MSSRLAGAAIFLIAALYAWTAQGYSLSFGDVLGPSVFPVIIAVPAMALALSMVVFPGTPTEWPKPARLIRQGMVLTTLIAYAFLLRPLGFPVATAALIALLAVMLDGPPIKSVIIGVVGALGLWLLFDQLLGLPIDFFGSAFKD